MMGYIKNMRKHIGHGRLLIAGAGVFIHRDGKLLLQKRRDNGCWGDHGGCVELGETFEQTARRELYEETGLVAGYLEQLCLLSGEEFFYTYPNGDKVSIVGVSFLCEDFTGEALLETEETTDLKWFALGEIPKNISPPVIPALKKCLEVLKGRQAISDLLYRYEKDFMSHEFCRHGESLNSRISDDFVELGQSGRRFNKKDVIDNLSKIPGDRNIDIRDFNVRRLSDDSYLATYRAHGKNKGISNRSSVWVNIGGVWKIVFHQGTGAPFDKIF